MTRSEATEQRPAVMTYEPPLAMVSPQIQDRLNQIQGCIPIVHNEQAFPNGMILATTGQPTSPELHRGMHIAIESHKRYGIIVVPIVITGQSEHPNLFDRSLGMISRIGDSLTGGDEPDAPQYVSRDSRLRHLIVMADVRQDKHTEWEEANGKESVIIFHGEANNARILARQLKYMGHSDGTVVLDYHSHRAAEWFDSEGLPFINITAAGKFKKWLDANGYSKEDPNTAIVTSDTGDLTRAWELSKRTGIPLMGIIHKTRRDQELKTKLSILDTDLKNKKVVIWDDMISSAGTLLRDAEALFEQGVDELVFMATHAVFVGKYKENIEELKRKYGEKLKIVTTNSLHHNETQIPNGIEIIDISDIISQAAEIMLQNQTFEQVKRELENAGLVHKLQSPTDVLELIGLNRKQPSSDETMIFHAA